MMLGEEVCHASEDNNDNLQKILLEITDDRLPMQHSDRCCSNSDPYYVERAFSRFDPTHRDTVQSARLATTFMFLRSPPPQGYWHWNDDGWSMGPHQ